ncbi:hypothetical protein ACFV9G_02745 [Nocardioides sp. NPDC059952]|uniref:hypothetical protein n=1 Tax=Nocardioides sp. NPDC059952 TaxID=3347014 RepID=UPI0036584243
MTDQPMPPQLPAPQAKPRSPGRVVAIIAALLSVCLVMLAGVVGVAVWVTQQGDGDEEKKPFTEAIAELGEAEGIVYKDVAVADTTVKSLTVTQGGMRMGQAEGGAFSYLTTPAGDQITGPVKLLSVDDTLFYRATTGDAAKQPWMTGDESADLARVVDMFASPKDLAASLSRALSRARADDLPEGPADVETYAGVKALRASTPTGDLLITSAKPHQLLGVEPPAGSRTVGAPAVAGDGVKTVAYVSGPAGSDGVDPMSLAGEGMELDPVPPAEADPMYADMEKETSQLSKAVDTGVTFNANLDGNVQCSAGGCTATANIHGTLSSGAQSRITGGQVTANMTASFTIDGGAAGSCSTSGSLGVSGGSAEGTMSCSAPGAGARFVAVEQQKKAALGSRGGRYSFPYAASVQVVAVARVQVERLVQIINQARDEAANAVPETLRFGSRAAAREGLPGDLAGVGNRFFRGATAKSQDFQAVGLPGGGYRLQFFSPANNPGYGKLYVQEIDRSGNIVSRYKDTIGPDGFIERKFLQ